MQGSYFEDTCLAEDHMDPQKPALDPPTTINLIGFMESTKDFTLQKPDRSHFLKGLGSLGYTLVPPTGLLLVAWRLHTSQRVVTETARSMWSSEHRPSVRASERASMWPRFSCGAGGGFLVSFFGF